MKKIISLPLLLLALQPALHAQTTDKVKITFIGFNCNNETWDNPLEMDGKGDEVFMQCNWVMANNSGNSTGEGKFRSLVHGDINGHNGWIQAGSRSDKGGIRSGDQYRGETVIGEITMEESDVLTITPTIWEWDGAPDAFTAFGNFYSQSLTRIAYAAKNAAAKVGAAVSNTLGRLCIQDFKSNGLPVYSYPSSFLLGQAKDRPIGITESGEFNPQSIILTKNQIRQMATINMGYGPGVLQVDYDEPALGNNRDHGAYTILVRIGYSGSPAPPAAPKKIPVRNTRF